jgi:hypothetical protein
MIMQNIISSDFQTSSVPQKILDEYKYNCKALINFLKERRTVMAPDITKVNQTVEKRKSNGQPVAIRRGYGSDCLCFGTGFINGQVLCGQHIPDSKNLYIKKFN